MKLGLSLVLLTFLFVSFTSDILAQDTDTTSLAQSSNSAAQTAESLRAQLREVQEKEAALKIRARDLDEQLKPENIERSFAGVGSTRPEELREMRRRQLNIEKKSVLTQLEQLETIRARLESAILTADTEAYHQSAQGTTPLNQMVLTQYFARPYFPVVILGGFLLIGGVVALIVVTRRPK